MVQLGDIAAGLGSGLQAGVQANQKQQALEIQEEQLGIQKLGFKQKNADALAAKDKDILSYASQMLERNPNFASDPAMKANRDLLQSILSTDTGRAQFTALMAATPDAAAQAAMGAGASVAGANEVARLTGQAPEDAQRAAGLRPAPVRESAPINMIVDGKRVAMVPGSVEMAEALARDDTRVAPTETETLDVSPTAKIKLQEFNLDALNVRSAIQNYRDVVANFDFKAVDTAGNLVGINGPQGAVLQQAYTAVLLALKGKSFAELGVLAGPDLNMLERLLVDPLSPQAARVGKEGILRLTDAADKMMSQRIDNAMAVYLKDPTKSELPNPAGGPTLNRFDDMSLEELSGLDLTEMSASDLALANAAYMRKAGNGGN